MSGGPDDRAAVVARTITAIVKRYRGDDVALHAQIAELLREEFADAANQAVRSIRLEDE